MPVQHNQSINLLSWNAQAISNYDKLFELNLLLKGCDIDILCLQETFLNGDQKVFLNGYKTFRRDRGSHGGGVAIAVKKDIKCKQIDSFRTSHIENVAILLEADSRQILMVSAYSPSYSRDLADDIKLLFSLPFETIVLGDLNARHSAWGCSNNNRAGLALH